MVRGFHEVDKIGVFPGILKEREIKLWDRRFMFSFYILKKENVRLILGNILK